MFLVIGCTLYKPKDDLVKVGSVNDRAYIEQLNYFAESLILNSGLKIFTIKSKDNPFLTQLLNRVLANNEILMAKTKELNFVFVEDNLSYIFSLPDNYIFISTGVVLKHLKSEAMFASAIMPELIRLNWKLYEKNIQFPSGFFSLEKANIVTRLPQKEREKLNEWSFVALKRAKYDPSVYLNWIQVQNRNNNDFLKSSGDLKNISKEEQQLKNFITNQGAIKVVSQVSESNSSKEFYKLINIIESRKR